MDLTLTTSELAAGSMLIGGGALVFGLSRLAGAFMRKTEALETLPVDLTLRETHLISLAQRAGWVEVDDQSAYWDDVRNLYTVWREPHSITSPDRPLYVNDPTTELFYNEHVRASAMFAKMDLHRSIIIQLLELLDKYRKEPSVVVKDQVEGDKTVGDAEDDKYDQSSFQLLSKVSLHAHTINVARIVCTHLYKDRYGFRIPAALIAALAHDLGKAKDLRQGRNSREHPAISCDVLRTLPGFTQLRSHKEILMAVRHHHTGAGAIWLTKLLQSADHEARRTEYEEQLKSHQGVNPKGSAPLSLEALPWTASYTGPFIKDMVRQIPITLPTGKVPCDIPPTDIYQKEEEDGQPDAVADPASESQSALPANDNGQTLNDPLLAKVVRWVQQTDLEEYTIETIMQEFQVSATRAEALFSGLTNQGVLAAVEKTPAVAPASTLAETPATSDRYDDDHDLLGLVPESDIVFLPKKKPKPKTVVETAPAKAVVVPSADPVYGTVSALDAPAKIAEECAMDYAEITPWFVVERFLDKLRPRVNVDKKKPRKDGKGSNTYFQAVSVGKELYVYMQGFKEILADLLQEHGDVATAQWLLVKPITDQEFKDQGQIINQVLRYFRDNGGVNNALVPEGCTGMWCHIEIKGEGKTRREWMLPFLLDELYPGEGDALRKRINPKDNPFVNKVIRVTPERLLGVRSDH